MNITFVIIFLVIAIILAIFVLLALRAKRWNFKGRTLAQAIPAQATVVRLERKDSQSKKNSKVSVKLTLDVQHPSLPVYRAETLWLIDILAIPQIQPQQIVQVKVNAFHPDRIYPGIEMAEFFDWNLTDFKSGLPPEVKAKL